MIDILKDICSSSNINKAQIRSLAHLGIFSLGLSYLLYFFLQYFFTPLSWWLTPNIESLGWMNDVLVLFEIQGLEVFNIQFLYYYLLGIIAVIYGCYYLPEKLVRTKSRLIVPKWNPDIAENICWLLFLSYIASTNIGDLFGIVCGLLITGILYKLIFSNNQQRSPIFVMLYVLMWIILILWIEGRVSDLYANSIEIIFLCLIVHIAITYQFSRGYIHKILPPKIWGMQQHENMR